MVVEVFIGYMNELRVMTIYNTMSRPLSDFTFGPEVDKPEGLESQLSTEQRGNPCLHCRSNCN